MIDCPICESKKVKKLIKWKKYPILKCVNCSLIFSTPLPSENELAKFYQGFMFNKPENHEIQKQIKKRKKELKELFNLPKKLENLSGKKFLDYGGGTGIVYKTASILGFNSYYHDLDNESREFTINKFGLTTAQIIDKITECNVKFDYMFSDNVIEHVKNPKRFVQDLLNQLNNKGLLVIKTPHASNTESILNPAITLIYFAKALKYNSFKKSFNAYVMRFWHCDPPRHLYSFSRNSLDYLMAAIKTENIEYKISYYNVPLFTNTITKKFFSKNTKFKGVRLIFFRLIALPIIPIEVLLQITKQLLLKMRILSSGGIILTVRKTHNNV